MHKNNSTLPDSTYPTKRDWWLVIPLLGVSLFGFYVPVILFSEPVHPLVKIFGSIFFIVMSTLLLWIIFGTSYTLTNEHLIITCLSRQYRIPLGDITEVFPTHNPLSAPACSLDRLRIKFKGHKFGALISPKNKTRFMLDLESRCPQLVLINNRLILYSKTEAP